MSSERATGDRGAGDEALPRLDLAVVAPEFPPDFGGMAELARGLTEALTEHARVTVYTFDDKQRDTSGELPYAVEACLSGSPDRDLPLLKAVRPDAWLALNAGYVPALAALEAPTFAYLHGNDFLNPWIACGPPWFEAVHRPYMASPRHALRRIRIRAHLPRLRRVFVNSRNTAELVARRMALPPQRIAVHPPGVNEVFFQHPEADGDSLRLLTVCRLTRHTARKNVDGVLAALAAIGTRLDWRYTVVGDGDDRQRLEDLAQELGIDDRVDFRGSLTLPQLLEAYRKSDLFVLTPKATRKDVEGFGIVYIEASASGVPVLASREGGATDAISEGENGLLIPTSSVADIAAGIERFAASRETFSPDRARRFAEVFRWPKIARGLYRDLASRVR